MILLGENRGTRREIYSSANFLPTNPTQAGLEYKPDLRSDRPATNHLNHGTTMGRKK